MKFVTTTKLQYEYTENKVKFYTLKDDLIFVNGKERIIVPRNLYKTDIASVPYLLTWLFKRQGKYTNAAILHDYLTDDRKFPLLKAHWYFLKGMKHDGVGFFTRSTFFVSVLLFGWIFRYF